MSMNHQAGQQVVNARLMSEVAIQFNIGADIFGKGNRVVESKLGSENMSGDTVMVPVYALRVNGDSLISYVVLP